MVKRAISPTDDLTEIVIHLLGGKSVFRERPEGTLGAHRLIESGIPSSAIVFLIGSMGIVGDSPALEAALGISRRTIQRKKGTNEVLNRVQSGRTWKFAEILAKAIDVFGSQQEAEKWLNEPSIGLENYRPIELLTTPAGVEIVELFLDRVSSGVYT